MSLAFVGGCHGRQTATTTTTAQPTASTIARTPPTSPPPAAVADDALVRQRCLDGDGPACEQMASRLGIDLEAESAAEYAAVSKKCANGDGCACADEGARLGIGGMGAPKDPAKALVLEVKACDLKCGLGCENAGKDLLDGTGAERDEARGYGLLERACVLDASYACTLLGRRALATRPPNRAKAVVLFKKACRLRDQSGCAALEAFTTGDR